MGSKVMRRLIGNARCNECGKLRRENTAFDERYGACFLVCDFCLRHSLPSPLGRKHLNRAAYEKLITENLAWLDSMPRTLERDHIQLIVQLSPEREFGPKEPVDVADPSTTDAYDPDAFIIECMKQAWGIGSGARRDEIAGTIEARPPDLSRFHECIDRLRRYYAEKKDSRDMGNKNELQHPTLNILGVPVTTNDGDFDDMAQCDTPMGDVYLSRGRRGWTWGIITWKREVDDFGTLDDDTVYPSLAAAVVAVEHSLSAMHERLRNWRVK